MCAKNISVFWLQLKMAVFPVQRYGRREGEQMGPDWTGPMLGNFFHLK
jgi:hypothetical protein